MTFLRSYFGAEDVIAHPPAPPGASRHCPDAWIASLDCYVEYDGVYWHGLDRPLEKLSPFIRRKYDRDRAFDSFCTARGYRLVRMMDVVWLKLSAEDRRAWCASLGYEERPTVLAASAGPSR